MKLTSLTAAGALLALSVLLTQAGPLGTAFNYQGRLSEGGQPANGLYDLKFALFDAVADGVQIGSAQTNSPVAVSNGVFNVTLDFGPGVFAGEARWLELGLRAHGSAGAFVILTPRQELTPTPQAIYAASAGVAGTANGVATNAVLSWAIPTGQVVKSVNNLRDDLTLAAGENVTITPSGNTLTIASPGAGPVDWHVLGNAGTIPGLNFVGTLDPQPLELKVNRERALRLEPSGGAPNVIGGWSNNWVAAGIPAATIAGGGDYNTGPNRVSSGAGAVGGGVGNTIDLNSGAAVIAGGTGNYLSNAVYSGIGGGERNQIQGGWEAHIGGGVNNTISNMAHRAAILGGADNRIEPFADGASIGGGWMNTVMSGAERAAIGGGAWNVACGLYAAVPGGSNNTACGWFSLAGGQRARAYHTGSFVWGDATPADFATTASNQFLIRASGGVGIGTNAPATALHVAGAVTANAFLGNGSGLTGLTATNADRLDNLHATSFLRADTSSALASGTLTANAGTTLDVQGTAKLGVSVVKTGTGLVTNLNADLLDGYHAADLMGMGGSSNAWLLTGNAGTVPGTHFLGTTDNKALELKVNNARALRIEPSLAGPPNLIGGAPANTVVPITVGATISGGGVNTISATGDYGTIGGGGGNQIGMEGRYSTIAGGQDNWTDQDVQAGTVGGGSGNLVGEDWGTIAGGTDNSIGWGATAGAIAGGRGNALASGAYYATIGGGAWNTNYSYHATIAGGYQNLVDESAAAAAIAGGEGNAVSAQWASIPGGFYNTVSTDARYAAIGGGYVNSVDASARAATIAGGYQNTIESGAACATISGGSNNVVASDARYASLAGGYGNAIESPAAAVGGGYLNAVGTNCGYSTISGGALNTIAGNSDGAAIGGGDYNSILNSGKGSTISGGVQNTNRAGVQFATIPGGRYNEVGGHYSFAAGYRAHALNQGSFVWADSTEADFSSTTNNSFLIRASGGVGIGTGTPAAQLHVVGDVRATGLLRSGSESGTAETPSPAGLVVRRINSMSTTAGQVLARTDKLTLERDGTDGGFRISYPANPGIATFICCMGMDRNGNSVNFYKILYDPGYSGTVQVYSNAQQIVHFRCTFGSTDTGARHETEVTLSRYADGSYNDPRWMGTVTSTYNQ